mgnify:FL=1
MTTTYYSVQVLEDGFPRLVPHTGGKLHEFLDKKIAIEFRDQLKLKNPDEKFRILKKTEKYTHENWI